MKGYDYSQTWYYFITVCTEWRISRFGKIEDGKMIVNSEWRMIERWWRELENRFDNIHLDAFVMMPNHFHWIIEIVGADLCVCPNLKQGEHTGSPLQEHKHDEHTGSPLQKRRIWTMIQWFKTMSTNECIREIKCGKLPPFKKHLWQRNYFEHIIRNEKSLIQIREYIQNNPNSWKEDTLFEG